MKKITFKEFFNKFNYYYDNQNYSNLGGNIFHRIYIFIDYMFSFLVEGCSLTNYFVYGFFNMKHTKKKQFVTWRRQRWIYRQCNDVNYDHYLGNKKDINTLFEKYVKRDWIMSNESTFMEFCKFVDNNPIFIAKPEEGTEGRGVQKFENLNDEEKKHVYDELSKEAYLLEKYIVQHEVISKLHPYSVNTIRITTIRDNEKVNIMSAALRMGRDKAVNDNYTTMGIVAQVDIDTGIIMSTGVDKLNHRYVKHPTTGEQIVGLKIPYWKECIEFVNELAQVVPQVRYTGWDIAITEDGPILIEGNYSGNFQVQQHGDMVGKYQLYKDVIARIK